MHQDPSRIAPGASTDERAPSSTPAADDPLAFEPAELRYRADGWTQARQREYVEALADLGVAKWAAKRVGMTEQSASRLRRRADARSFDAACEAAQRIGSRNCLSAVHAIALEGRVKKHFYKGELVGEERIHDTRLLIALLPRLAPSAGPSPESLAVEKNWQPWLDAIERGEDPAAPVAAVAAVEEDEFNGSECWEEDGGWWTSFPPPAGFDGLEERRWGEWRYRRTLTAEEEAVLCEESEAEGADSLAAARAARDRYFGFVPAAEEIEVKGSRGPLPSRTGHELSEPSEPFRAGRRPIVGRAASGAEDRKGGKGRKDPTAMNPRTARITPLRSFAPSRPSTPPAASPRNLPGPRPFPPQRAFPR